MSAAPAPRPSHLHTALLLALAVSAGGGGYALWRGLADLTAQQQQNQRVLEEVLGEVTRMRLEQSAGSKGPQALLEKLRLYAPLVATSRTTEPDFKSAKKEMAAIVRAFGTLGKDAWQPIAARLEELKPDTNYDEIKELLRAAVAVDHDAGVQLLELVLLGRKLPNPRLRWEAGRQLVAEDRPRAQRLLKQVLLTETNKGFDPDHANAYPGMVVPDKAAMSATGFYNFVEIYELSGDPKVDETLLMVLGRPSDDKVTIQTCLKILGSHRCKDAVAVIEKFYQKPPQQQQDPLFLGQCLESLVDIQGAEARPFLEAALPNASSDTVATKIQYLLKKIADGDLAPKPRAAPVPDDKEPQKGK